MKGKWKTDIIFEEQQERHCHTEVGEVICSANNEVHTAMTFIFCTNTSEAGYICEYIYILKYIQSLFSDLNSLLHIILDSHYNYFTHTVPSRAMDIGVKC